MGFGDAIALVRPVMHPFGDVNSSKRRIGVHSDLHKLRGFRMSIFD